jgi:uncharacterized protein HemX
VTEPEQPEQPVVEYAPVVVQKTNSTALGIVAIVAVVALVIAAWAFAGQHQDTRTIASQAAEIHLLDQSNTRLAQEQAADVTQRDQVSAQLAQMSSRLAAADPSSSLITCADLRHIRLMVVSGGTVSAVPGSVNLAESSMPFPLPRHCL